MGVLRPFVQRTQSVNSDTTLTPSDKLATPANFLTAIRPVLGGAAAYLLLRKPKARIPATAVALVAAITDMDGSVARKISARWPNSELGLSNKGKIGDPVADTITLGEIATGVFFGLRTSRLGKAAVIIVAAQEAFKARQIMEVNGEYRDLAGSTMELPITPEGKEAMAEKMLAGGLATATNDIESPVLKTAAGIAAISFAIAGAIHGHEAHKKNMQAAQDMIHQAYVRHIIMDLPAVAA